MNEVTPWAIAVVASLLSAYASACMLALESYNLARLRSTLEERGLASREAFFNERNDELLLVTGTIRILCNLAIALVVFYLFSTRTPESGNLWHYTVAFVIAAVVISIFSVAVPVSIARHLPELTLVRSYFALRIALLILTPIANALHLFDPMIRRMLGVDLHKHREDPVSQEVLSVVQEHEEQGAVDETQKQIIEAVFDLPNTTAGQIMTPRTEIQALSVASDLETVKEAVLRFGHSRIPVFEGTIDNILGILYAKDLLPFLSGGATEFNLRKALRDAPMVPESKPVRALLAEFRSRKVHIAIVIDEYGGTAGLLTIEDIIEELVGEIHDEHEGVHEPSRVTRLDERSAEADARITIQDINDELGLSIPEDSDYDTLGGFVLASLDHIPDAGETFEHDGVRYTVADATRTTVKRVKIEKLEEQGVATDEPRS